MYCISKELLSLNQSYRFDNRTGQPDDDGQLVLPKTSLSALGDQSFLQDHDCKLPYVGGAMANGIASEQLVGALVKAGCLGIFGAAGLPVSRVEAAIDRLQQELGKGSYGFNLIHSPQEQDLEFQLATLYLAKGIQLVEASAYLKLTPAIVLYRVKGLTRDASGQIRIGNRVMAKISRQEVARQFLAPAPEPILEGLIRSGDITAFEADLARQVPMCDDLTVESDSGGHTDNRPALTLLPTMISLRDQIVQQHKLTQSPRVGLAGGIATPAAAAAGFHMGAGYIVIGSVHQACLESGSSDLVRKMLAEASDADIAMAPAADMFEMGVKVQVLKRGTMFPMRAAKLYEYYSKYSSIEELPPNVTKQLEQTYFRDSLANTWQRTVEFFADRDPAQITKAEQKPKHKLALLFRSYLGQSSHWANAGVKDRQGDFQIWCGPAMGAFNAWTRDTFLAQPENRDVATVALNLCFGAAVLNRANILRSQGVSSRQLNADLRPRTLSEIQQIMENGVCHD